MGLNLHAMVRGAIQSVNPDIPAVWYAATGQVVTDDAGVRRPRMVTNNVMIQVQPIGSAIRQLEGLNVQDVVRRVHMYSDVQGMVRTLQLGGDILEFDGQKWRVHQVLESWHVGWCSVAVVLQKPGHTA